METEARRSRQRKSEAGQGLIEVALLLPVLFAVVLLTVDTEWSIFQVQELQDAANGAARATLANGPKDFGGPVCDQNILPAIRQAAAVLPISSGACLQHPAGGQTNVLQLVDGNLKMCITSNPTIYYPSHVTAVVTDRISGLVPLPIFNLTVTATSETTTGSNGVPGTAQASPDPSCP
jgi:Flp pilus assembly protein TadG